jgi:hypothetical protein
MIKTVGSLGIVCAVLSMAPAIAQQSISAKVSRKK